MNCFRLANAMNNTTIINPLNSENIIIVKVKTQNCQIMAIIANKILKLESWLKNQWLQIIYSLLLTLLVESIPSLKINSISKYYIYQIKKNNLRHCQKDYHHNNLSFLCLQFYKHNCLYIPASKNCFTNEVKSQWE